MNFTTPEEIKSKSFKERLNVPFSEIYTILSSSSNKGLFAQTKNDVNSLNCKNLLNRYGRFNIPKGNYMSFISYGWYGATNPINIIKNSGLSVFFLPSNLIEKKSLHLIKELDVKGIISLPYTLVFYIKFLKSRGIDPKSLNLDNVHIMGEATSDYVINYIKNELGVKIYEFYGSADTGTIAIGDDNELVAFDDEYALEIINNEITVTTLKQEAMPLVNYKLGDVVDLNKNNNKYFLKVRGRTCECIKTEKGYILPTELDDIIFPITGEPVCYKIENKDNPTIHIDCPEELKKELHQKSGMVIKISKNIRFEMCKKIKRFIL